MKTNLLLGIHCHQPIDNFDNVVFEIIEKSYKPFFKVLQNHPSFRCSVHFSGWLLEFIQKHDEELFTLMQSLSKQLEFFTGGFYEPILASIPSCDRVAQIEKLSSFIKENFNQTPRGAWLTERIWDDSIIDDLCSCGIEYLIVDDYHLIASGVAFEKLNGYYVTENSNNHIALFPISKKLRYEIPFISVDAVIDSLHQFANKDGQNGAIIFDDGEKFGVWPDTYKRVYEEGWLDRFLTRCVDDEQIDTITYKEFYDKNNAIGAGYLPTVSYHEMGEWSLFYEAGEAYHDTMQKIPNSSHLLRGGVWKNFFLKYQESNWMHKRMLELSKNRIDDASYLDSLYKIQCNDVYWHGVFGGIYLPNLRDNAYNYIINCENILDYDAKVIKEDIDFDTFDEYRFYTKDIISVISQKYGGEIVELDIRDRCFNLQNTLTRYKEHYHKKIEFNSTNSLEKSSGDDAINSIHNSSLKTDGLMEIYYDAYKKNSAIDHISDSSFCLEDFKSATFKKFDNFLDLSVESFDKNKIEMNKNGLLDNENFSISKSYRFDSNNIFFSNNLETNNQNMFKYIIEWNLHFQSYDMLDINSKKIENEMQLYAKELVILDNSLGEKIVFEFDKDIEIYIYKVNSVSQSEVGIDYTTQGLSIGFAKEFCKTSKFNYRFEVVRL